MIISKERIAHMHGVAELMYKYESQFDCKCLTKEELYYLGLVHDIGYLNGKKDHEKNGAELFNRYSTLYHCIYWHGVTPQEYMKINNCSSKDDIPGELILLWWADMMIESGGEYAGENVGFKDRLEGIKERYGEDSSPYKICIDTISWLNENVQVIVPTC